MDAHSTTGVILWSAPRCTSTLFEHSIGQLPHVKTFHEVFTNAAYFGEERTFNRYVVIDFDELLSRPRDTMQAYCDHLGLGFQETMLAWDNAKSGERLERWGSVWYRTLLNSTGFAATAHPDSTNHPPLPAPVEAAIEAAQPCYEKLYARRLPF